MMASKLADGILFPGFWLDGSVLNTDWVLSWNLIDRSVIHSGYLLVVQFLESLGLISIPAYSMCAHLYPDMISTHH